MCHGAANAQEHTVAPVYIGIGGTYGLNFHDLNLPVYRSDGTHCGTFTSGSGGQANFFLLYERPVSDDQSFWISPRVHFNNLSAVLTTPATDNAHTRSPIDSSLVALNREHHLSAGFQTLGLDLYGKYQILHSVFAFGGPTVAMLVSKSLDQREVIVSPSGATFEGTTSAERILYRGDLPNANDLQAGFTLGATADLPLGKKLKVSPEASYTLPLTKVQSDYDWRVSALRFGLALKIDLTTEPKPEPPPAIVVEHRPDPSLITASVTVSGVPDPLHPQVEQPVPTIRIEELATREGYPLLNYIFFDEGSAEIPTRYHQIAQGNSASFDTTSLIGRPALDVYHDLLNVLGRRMQAQPKTTITLTGSNANAGKELNAMDLSRSRAESVKRYLVDVWGIKDQRIKIEALNLPRTPSNEASAQGAEENRRVEITASEPSLFDPLILEKIDRVMNPPVLRVRSSIASRYPVSDSRITLTQSNSQLASFSPAAAQQDWQPSPNDLPKTEEPLIATLQVRDSIGGSSYAYDTSRVNQLTIKRKREERIADKIVERYNLITFDFDKADLDPRSKRVVAEIAKNVTPRDNINITGYTDLLGDEQHNKKLSEDRARNVAEALDHAIASNGTATHSEGLGEKDLVDNSLPEGRFLSRTVMVRIERPVATKP